MELIEVPLSGPPRLSFLPDPYTLRMVDADQAFYGRVGFAPPWICYLALRDDRVVGTCGFKGAPKNGEVEIAYHTFPEHEGQGVATAMAGSLVRIANDHDPSIHVTAQTRPLNTTSSRILQKLGFIRTADGHDEEIGPVHCWQWSGQSASAPRS